MPIKNPEDLNIAVLYRKKVVLVHIVVVAFPAAVLHILKLLFIISLKMIKNILSVQYFLRIVEQDFVVPGFLGVLEVVDPGRH